MVEPSVINTWEEYKSELKRTAQRSIDGEWLRMNNEELETLEKDILTSLQYYMVNEAKLPIAIQIKIMTIISMEIVGMRE